MCAHLFVVVTGAAHGDWARVIVRVVASGQSHVDVIHLGHELGSYEYSYSDNWCYSSFHARTKLRCCRGCGGCGHHGVVLRCE